MYFVGLRLFFFWPQSTITELIRTDFKTQETYLRLSLYPMLLLISLAERLVCFVPLFTLEKAISKLFSFLQYTLLCSKEKPVLLLIFCFWFHCYFKRQPPKEQWRYQNSINGNFLFFFPLKYYFTSLRL